MQFSHTAKLTDGMFYMEIVDELLSSMEMSCRMGRWVVDMVF
jgi:hypothetical protein